MNPCYAIRTCDYIICAHGQVMKTAVGCTPCETVENICSVSVDALHTHGMRWCQGGGPFPQILFLTEGCLNAA